MRSASQALDGTVWEGCPFHVSLCFEAEADPQALQRVVQRWDGRLHHFKVRRVTYGGTAELALDDLICQDADLHTLKAGGSYSRRHMHISMV